MKNGAFYGNAEKPIYAPRWYLIVGADPCVRPIETSYVSYPFSANSSCPPQPDKSRQAIAAAYAVDQAIWRLKPPV